MIKILVTIRYPDRVDKAYIEPCKTKMFRVSQKELDKEIHKPRAERAREIIEVLELEPGLSLRKIGRRIGLNAEQVRRIIIGENIQRN